MIRELFILKEGVPIFAYEKGKGVLKEPLLSSGFMNAVYHLAKAELKEGINVIKMDDSIICLKEIPPILIVVVCDDEKEGKLFAERIGEEFLKEYGRTIEKWNGEISVFRDFHKKVDRLLNKRKSIDNELAETLSKVLDRL
ncbi:MAG: hypothetical protein QXK43_07595 [Candidatus Jordarchaeales archaeon]